MKYLLFVGIALCLFSCSDSKEEAKPRYIDEEVEPLNFYGNWYAKNDIDSTVVIFEPTALTIYIYERKTKKLLERHGFGKWCIIHRSFTNEDFHRYLLKFYNDSEYYIIEYDDKYTVFTFVDLNEFSGLTVTRIREE